MAFELKLPDIGEGVAEGEIVRWLVKVGDAVKEHQPLVEVMTDKASVEIPSPRTGTVAALHAQEGQIVPVGTVILSIEVAGEVPRSATGAGEVPRAAGQTEARAGSAAKATSAVAAAPTPAGKAQAMPAVRQLAKQLGVAIETLTGTGAGGAITADDVRRAAGAGAVAAAVVPPAASSTAATSSTAAAGATASASGPEERVPLRGLRRKIAEHMRHSLDTAAHFTFVAECDMTEIVRHRESLLPRARERGASLTYLAYLLKALVEPLRNYPLLNASLDDVTSEIVLKRYYHVGVAMATDEGLTVPVVHDVDRLTLLDVADEIHRLAVGARAGKLQLEDLQGGTFTVTSTGAHGGLLATPILHHPQVAILGIHEVKPRPAVVDGQIVARDMTNLSLSLDHRVVDGAVGAHFLYAVIARLQSPAKWLAPEAIG